LVCPECGSSRVNCNGHRTLSNGLEVQRFGCKDCGVRFIDPNSLKVNANNKRSSQQNKSLRGLEILDTQTETKTVCAGLERLPQDAKGLITKYMAYLEKEGYYTDSTYVDLLKSLVLKDRVNLLDPEDVKNPNRQAQNQKRTTLEKRNKNVSYLRL
jgi:hypothetical protein